MHVDDVDVVDVDSVSVGGGRGRTPHPLHFVDSTDVLTIGLSSLLCFEFFLKFGTSSAASRSSSYCKIKAGPSETLGPRISCNCIKDAEHSKRNKIHVIDFVIARLASRLCAVLCFGI
jgi:hypothetical protein